MKQTRPCVKCSGVEERVINSTVVAKGLLDVGCLSPVGSDKPMCHSLGGVLCLGT